MDKERRRALGALTHELGIGGLDLEMLDVALTHPSYAMEHNLDHDNQRLEFLGDAVLEIILTEYLFNLYPDAPEGEMTKMRSALVREAALARLARKLRLGDYLRTTRRRRCRPGFHTGRPVRSGAGSVLPGRRIRCGARLHTPIGRRGVPRPAFAADHIESQRTASGVLPAALGNHTGISGPAHQRSRTSADLRCRSSSARLYCHRTRRKHAESEAAKSLYHFLVNQEKCR